MTCCVVKCGKGRAFRDGDGHVFHPDENLPIIICGGLYQPTHLEQNPV
jgi:hypothetical protein